MKNVTLLLGSATCLSLLVGCGSSSEGGYETVSSASVAVSSVPSSAPTVSSAALAPSSSSISSALASVASISSAASSALASVASISSVSSASSSVMPEPITLSSDFRAVHFLVDAAGMSLYTFDNDTLDMSNCVGECLVVWPPFQASVTDNEDFGTLDGVHTTYRSHPLYYYQADMAAGDVNGDNHKEVWHLLYPADDFVPTAEAALSSEPRIQTYLTDAEGWALYTFDNDEVNVSRCYGDCASIWPVLEGAVTADGLPMGVDAAKFSTTQRTDGTLQTVYDGKPLYYFINDAVPGDTHGDWVKGVWHLIELDSEAIAPAPVALDAASRDVSYLVDGSGMSLYTFDNDTLGASNCVGECLVTWPPFTADVGHEDFAMIDGGHTMYRKHPLYYFKDDMNPGDVFGDKVKKVWHLLYPNNDFVDTAEAARSEGKRTQTYLTDAEGRALYTFDNDDANVSNCYDACEQAWPIFDVAGISEVPEGIDQAGFSVIARDANRSEHGTQIAYKGQPLYYFVNDAAPGATNGDWVKGVWHLIDIHSTDAGIAAGRAKFESTCTVCHGDDGRTMALGVSRIIADIDSKGEVKTLLTALKNGAPDKHPAMVGVAQGLTDEEIDQLSAFVATLP